jgi:hypothetical protein
LNEDHLNLWQVINFEEDFLEFNSKALSFFGKKKEQTPSLG